MAASDILEHILLLKSIQERAARVLILDSIKTKILHSSVRALDILDMLQILCEEMISSLGASNCRIALLDPFQTTLTVVAEYYLTPEEHSSIGHTFTLADNPLFKETIETDIAPGWHKTSSLAVRLLAADKMAAGIMILDKIEMSQSFDIDEVEFALIVIDQIVGWIDKTDLYRIVEQVRK